MGSVRGLGALSGRRVARDLGTRPSGPTVHRRDSDVNGSPCIRGGLTAVPNEKSMKLQRNGNELAPGRVSPPPPPPPLKEMAKDKNNKEGEAALCFNPSGVIGSVHEA